jgi:hypothetical protein
VVDLVGSVLCPTLFNIFLNPLLRFLTEIGKRKGIAHGIRSIDEFNNLAAICIQRRISLTITVQSEEWRIGLGILSGALM